MSGQSARVRADGGWGGRIELLRDLDRPAGWMLLADGVPQSHVDLGDPGYLEFEYMRRLGHLADLAAAPGQPLAVLHLGAGALTLARYVAATRPGSHQVAVDADAEVADLVRQRLPLGAAGGPGGIEVRVADARAALAEIPAGSFDLVVADVFAGARTPPHVTSLEFTREAARVLAPRGIYAVNVGDGPPLRHARGRVAAVRAVFPQVCVIAEAPVLARRRFGNLVVVASARPLPVEGLARRIAGDPFPARLLDGAELGRFTGDAEPITDASAEPSPEPPPAAFA